MLPNWIRLFQPPCPLPVCTFLKFGCYFLYFVVNCLVPFFQYHCSAIALYLPNLNLRLGLYWLHFISMSNQCHVVGWNCLTRIPRQAPVHHMSMFVVVETISLSIKSVQYVFLTTKYDKPNPGILRYSKSLSCWNWNLPLLGV